MSGTPTKSDRRAIRRSRVLKSGRIVLGQKAPKIDCAVRNVSNTGACIEIASSTFGVPMSFALDFNNEQFDCRVVWRTLQRIGVAFR